MDLHHVAQGLVHKVGDIVDHEIDETNELVHILAVDRMMMSIGAGYEDEVPYLASRLRASRCSGLVQMLRKIIEIFRLQLGEKGITLEIRVVPTEHLQRHRVIRVSTGKT